VIASIINYRQNGEERGEKEKRRGGERIYLTHIF